MSNESFIRTTYGRPDDLQLITKKFEIDPLLERLLNLCTVAGTEHHIVNIIRELPYVKKCKRFLDPKCGNYVVQVGKNSKTVFSAHMDIVGHNNPLTLKRDKVEKIFLFTPEETLKNADKYGMIWGAKANLNDKGSIESYTPSTLGADDKAGVYILLKMIEAQIPGKYIFHTGEECGGLGSNHLAANHKDIFDGVQRAIAFDRANYTDIIGFQRGGRCCSTEFGKALAEALNVGMPPRARFKEDVHGTFTDTANYTKLVPECTNVSVGYFSQHGTGEHLDSYWLETWLLPAILKVKYEDLPVKRDPKEVPKSTTYSYGNNWNNQYNNTPKKAWKDATKDTNYTEFPVWEPKLGIPEGANKEVLITAMGRYLSKINYGKDRDALCEWLIDKLETIQLLEEEIVSLNFALGKALGKDKANPPDVILLPPPEYYQKKEVKPDDSPTKVDFAFEEKIALLTRLVVISDNIILQPEPQKWLNNYVAGAKKLLDKLSKKNTLSSKNLARINRVIFAVATLLDEATILLPEEERVLDDVQKHMCETYAEEGWWVTMKGLYGQQTNTVH